MRIVVATPDLMTASRFANPHLTVVHARTADQVRHLLETEQVTWLVVDLMTFADLIDDCRSAHANLQVAGFAPHVHEDVLARARTNCDVVWPRGKAIREVAKLQR